MNYFKKWIRQYSYIYIHEYSLNLFLRLFLILHKIILFVMREISCKILTVFENVSSEVFTKEKKSQCKYWF